MKVFEIRMVYMEEGLLNIKFFFHLGARIHNPYHSDTCDVGAPIIKVLGVPLWQDPRSPHSIISPETLPGNCWPMKGTQGYIVVKVSESNLC